jgi:uracil-DNA glycosylase family 4
MSSSKNINSKRVPPSGLVGSKWLFVGEAPGEQEEDTATPFVGPSGELFLTCLGRAGMMREEVYIMNLSEYRPVHNRFEYLENSPELTDGIERIAHYIRTHKPNVVCAMGSKALKFLTGKASIDNQRGSILRCTLAGCEDTKVVPTIHPARVLRERELYPIFDCDIKRAIAEGATRAFNLPSESYSFLLNPKGLELEEAVERLCKADKLAVDIESVRDSIHILCVGFADSSGTAVCIVNDDSPSYFNAVNRILQSPAVKVMHFGTFDSTMLQLNGFTVNNFSEDTLVGQHILNPELPRGLDFLTSIYTRQPYYKDMGKSETKSWTSRQVRKELYEYNCLDVVSTFMIHEEQVKELASEDPALQALYRFEMDEIELAIHISMSGLLIDPVRREQFRLGLFLRWYTLQDILDKLIGRSVNVRSPALKEILYEQLGLPTRRKRDGAVTTDEDAIVSLITYTKGHIEKLKLPSAIQEWNFKFLVLKAILEIRGLRQLLSNYIKTPISEDGRIRSIYKVANVETGRWAAEGFVDGTGNNAQTFPRSSIDVPDKLLQSKVDTSKLESVASEDEATLDDNGTEGEGTDSV